MTIVVAARNEHTIYFCYDTRVETPERYENTHKVQIVAPQIAVGEAFHLGHDFVVLRKELRKRKGTPPLEALEDIFSQWSEELRKEYEIPLKEQNANYPIHYLFGIMTQDGPHIYTTKGTWPKLTETGIYGVGTGMNHPEVRRELAKCRTHWPGTQIGAHLARVVRFAKIHDPRLGGIGRAYLNEKGLHTQEYTPFRGRNKPVITLDSLADNQILSLHAD